MSERTGFTVEDDGLVHGCLMFDSDGDIEDNNDEDLGFTSANPCLASTPMPNRKLFGEEHMDSTCDSGIKSMIDNSGIVNKLMAKQQVAREQPPYKRMRSLRLVNSPQSPKTLILKSEIPKSDGTTVTRIVVLTPKPRPYGRKCTSDPLRRPLFSDSERKSSPSPQRVEANINPFCKSDLSFCAYGKRRHDSNGSSFNTSGELNFSDEEGAEKPWKQRKTTGFGGGCLSRYNSEFYQLAEIGSGEFGSVFQCLHRMDGTVYAIKKSRHPIYGTANEKLALREVYAHAVLGHHPHVVAYYSAWAENDYMLIQNEYCNGGNLAQLIEKKRNYSIGFSETEVKQILLHVALGLKHIHSNGLAHMDIKPANIFITNYKNPRSPNSSDDGFEDGECMMSIDENLCFKIGDLGHVTSLTSPDVEEGDCRYMAAEILQDDFRSLAKADIFALGLTILEVCTGESLPKNGADWHKLREGTVPCLPDYSKELRELIKEMTHPDPDMRPTSAALAQNDTLVPPQLKSKEQLSKELHAEKLKTQMLEKELETSRRAEKEDSRKKRLIGRKTNRSRSVTNF